MKRMKALFHFMLVTVIFAGLTLSGCGGGGGGTSGGGATNNLPVIAGDDIGAVTENATATTLTDSGTLTISDADAGEASFNTTSVLDTTSGNALGSISITSAGVWTYNVATTDVLYLADGQTKVETFTVASADGSTTVTITITITGRPLIFSNFQAASVVVGQSDFTGAAVNQGGTVAADTINNAYGNPLIYNGVLYLPDWFSSRVLGFNSIPTSNGASADFVLGQPDFFTDSTGVSQSYLGGPQTLSVDNGKFFMTDTDNSRILIYNTVPTVTPGLADVVVGQINFNSNLTATRIDGLSSPESSQAVAGKLIVADSDNNRVLIWNSIPTANGASADIVLGQNSFTNFTANDYDQDSIEDSPTASTLSYPTGVWSDGTKLVVLDSSNNRALIWNSFPTANFTPADLVLGQGDFISNAFNDDDQLGGSDLNPSNRTLDFPFDGVFSTGGQLFIADNSNDRVLIWNSFPTTNFARADVVLGQVDFTGDTGNDSTLSHTSDLSPSATTMNNPRGVFVEGNKLIVGDGLNNRYLIYDAQ